MNKQLSNQEIINQLKEALVAMEIKGSDRFRIRAYQNALTSLETSTFSIYDLWKRGKLDDIAGVGPSLTQHIGELLEKGTVLEFEALKKDLPDGMFALIGVQGIGPKKAYKLALAFKLSNRTTALERIKKAAETGEIRSLPGFGEKSEQQILASIAELKKTKNEKTRLLWPQGDEIVKRIYKHMQKLDEVLQIETLGSYRRKKETVGDLDIAVSTEYESEVMSHFLTFPEIKEILVQGDKKVSVVLENDFQVDFRTILPQQFGSMAQYFTGSKYHNIALRTYALEKGFSVSEYGIKKGKDLHEFGNEEDFYGFLGLEYIPPEIRQGSDEVELASKKELPHLVNLADIKGDLHTHTIFSDGLNTLEEMIAEAKTLGYNYLGITDHAPSIATRGYETAKKIIEENLAKIALLNSQDPTFRVLFGYEVNILADSTLGFPEEFLKELDFAIAGIHTSYNQSREEIMKRYLAALRNPLIKIIAHPAGRLLGERDPMDIDWMVFLEEVAKSGKILEINAQPRRLDLPYDLVKEARNMGIKLIINSDSHTTDSLRFMQYGVDVARRGWCEAANIVNTLPLEEFLRILK